MSSSSTDPCRDQWHDLDDGPRACPSCGYDEAGHCQHCEPTDDELDDCDPAADCVHCECCCTCLGCEYGPRDGALMFPNGPPAELAAQVAALTGEAATNG
ncbi:MAG TPA: hypothetical protein VFM54_06860 [Micromonosporaceae bacterium]|nr:hypothetical protein [Micromonosporaceae bacterium]